MRRSEKSKRESPAELEYLKLYGNLLLKKLKIQEVTPE